MTEFKTGDIVQLKSGGPKMTCAGTRSPLNGIMEYVWFAGSKKERGCFTADMLNLVTDEKESKEKK